MSTKLFDLASAKINQGDKEKAIAELKQQINDNKFSFVAAKHNAEKALFNAKNYASSLEANPAASPASIIEAERAVKLAEKDIEAIDAIMARRF